jgi:hypothetical protein
MMVFPLWAELVLALSVSLVLMVLVWSVLT